VSPQPARPMHLQMDTAGSTETLVNMYQATRLHMSGDIFTVTAVTASIFMSQVLLEKPAAGWLLKNFMEPPGSLPSSQEPSSPYPEPDQSSPPVPSQLINLRSTLILSTHLRLDPMCIPLLPIGATYSVHLILPDSMTRENVRISARRRAFPTGCSRIRHVRPRLCPRTTCPDWEPCRPTFHSPVLIARSHTNLFTASKAEGLPPCA
jgi:hypothetical protein